MTPVWRNRFSWSGLWLGPSAWALSLQTNYALVPLVCDGRVLVSTAIAAGLAIAALIGGGLSLYAARAPLVSEWSDSCGGVPRRFVAWLGAGAGLLFALAIANQLAATLVLNGCFR